MRLLLRYGVDPNRHKKKLKFAEDANVDKSVRNVLCLACDLGHLEIVRLLLDAGAAVSDNDLRRHTPPLHFALKPGVKTGSDRNVFTADRLAIIDLLLEHGACVNVASATDGRTPLVSAAAHGLTDVVRKLLDRGARPEHHIPSGPGGVSGGAGNGCVGHGSGKRRINTSSGRDGVSAGGGKVNIGRGSVCGGSTVRVRGDSVDAGSSKVRGGRNGGVGGHDEGSAGVAVKFR